jgi:hypothetical protein
MAPCSEIFATPSATFEYAEHKGPADEPNFKTPTAHGTLG